MLSVQKNIQIGLLILLCLISRIAIAENYLDRFQRFLNWNLHLPSTPKPDFVEFIHEDTPLTQKLRHRWLYQLAQNHQWQLFLDYYQPSQDVGLQCYFLLANVHLGKPNIAISDAKTLWLNLDSKPQNCNALFTWLLTTENPNQTLITERLRIALENRNIRLANYLFTLYKPPYSNDTKLLQSIVQTPKKIQSLQPGLLHDEFYLYGLKRLVSKDMNQAIEIWKTPKTVEFLNEKQNQSFLTFLVIYKAMRNDDDTEDWFKKIKPEYYTPLLIDWQIRHALKKREWNRVIQLIALSPQKDEPSIQYWLARALEQTGSRQAAHSIYQKLAQTRQYYGFLSSLRLKTKCNFMQETIDTNPKHLTLYQPIIDKIKLLYDNHHLPEASRLINDFVSELPKEDKGTFVLWIDRNLQWHNLAIYLSSNKDLNNLLEIRFPIAHQEEVQKNATKYQIPEELVYALIRQESSFRTDVISPAGAYGLMQIMPETAKKVARELKIPFSDKKQLFSSADNIKLGTAYLKILAKRYHNDPILMAAAYNAGPSQLNFWLKNHPQNSIDIWIDTLPWAETRNYLKNITAFFAVYQYRIRKKEDLNWLNLSS